MFAEELNSGLGRRFVLTREYNPNTDVMKVSFTDTFKRRTRTAFKKVEGRGTANVEEQLYSTLGILERFRGYLTRDIFFRGYNRYLSEELLRDVA
jgi:hypothetical protein